MILFVFGCKKEHVPASTTGTPEFYFNGTVAGTAISLDAGVNNYYMYSSYVQDTNNVYNFIGDLRQTTSSPNSIQIQILNYRVSAPNASVNIDSALFTGIYNYYGQNTVTTTTSTAYLVQFNSSYTNPNGTAQTYNWNFGDGTNSALANPSHLYSQLGYYNVCLNITGSNSCSNGICDTVNLSSQTTLTCQTVITSTVQGDTITFKGIASSNFSPTNHLWDFGDGTTNYDTVGNNIAIHSYNSPNVYQVSLTASDNMGHVSKAKYNVATASAPVSCITNYSVSSVQTTTVSSISPNFVIGLGNVIVTWTDASGNVYTSKNSAQPTSSGFQIISVDNHPNNANNQRVKKLHVKFSCWVYNSTHPAIQITNADAVIVVAYK